MGDRAFTDISDDFHVGVRMGGKAGVWRDLVVVPHPQRTMAHIFGVVMAAKGEVVLGLQPAMVRAAELCERSEFDHENTPFESQARCQAMCPVDLSLPEFRWLL